MASLIDANGQPIEVDDHAEADKLLRSGQAGLNPSKPVNLVGEDGKVFNVGANDAGQFLGSGGYRLAHSQEVAADLERQKYDTVGQQAIAGVEGVASGATMGLSDIAGKALVGNDYAQDSLKRAEYNPITRGIGEGVGVIGSAVLSGGAGATGAVARLAPAAMAVRAAEAAGVAAKAAEGASLAVRAASAVGRYAVEGAVEGALFGASAAVRDDYLRDHEITAERIAMGAGEGLLDGLKWGAAEGGLAGVGLVGKEAAAGLYAKLRKADTGVLDDAAAAVTGVPAQATPKSVTQQLDDYASGVTAKDRFKEAHATATREVTDTIDHSAELFDEVQAKMNIGFKPKAVQEALIKAPPADLRAMQSALQEEGVGILERFRAQLDAGTDVYNEAGVRLFKKAEKEFDNFDKRFSAGIAKGGIEGTSDALIAMDRYKRYVGQLQGSAGSGIHGDPAAVNWLKNEYHQQRDFLQRADVLGDGFAGMQRETNAAYTAYIPYAQAFDAEASLGKNLRTRRNKFDGFELTKDADPRKVGGILADVGGPTNYKSEEFLTKAPQLQADLAEKLAKYYDMGGDHAATVKALRDNANKIGGSLESLRGIKAEQAAYDATQETLKGLGPLIGGTVAGAREATQRLASATATVLSGSGAQAGMAAKIHKAAVSMANRAERALDGAAKALVATKRGVSAVPGAAAFVGHKYTADKHEDFQAHLDSMMEPDGKARLKTKAALFDLRQVSPEMADAQEKHLVNAAAFLKEKTAPKAQPRPSPFAGAQKPVKPQAQEALKAQRYVAAVSDPSAALKRVEKGTNTPQDLETLRALYPRLYGKLQAKVLQEVGALATVPDPDTQQHLSQVTGVPVNRIADPAYRASIQRLIKTAPTNSALAKQQQGAGQQAPDLAAQYATQWGGGGTVGAF